MGISARFVIILLLLQPALRAESTNLESLQISKISVDFAGTTPSGGCQAPRFTWIATSHEWNSNQVAWQLEMAGKPGLLEKGVADLWNSGRVESGVSLFVPAGGKVPGYGERCWYRLTVWDNHGNKAVSRILHFMMPVLPPSGWQARWIGAGPAHDPLPPKGFYSGAKDEGKPADSVRHEGRSMLLRHRFDLRGEVRSAVVSVTGLGLYELFLNGKRVGDQCLTPVKTPYHRQILYDTFDVTDLLKKGSNAAGLHLGNGWYNPYPKWWQEYRMQWFGHKKAIFQLRVVYADGSVRTVISDGSWKTAPGPCLYNCIYDGEIQDAGREPEGWTLPGFDDSTWTKATETEAPRGRLEYADLPPVRVIERLKPVRVTTPVAGTRIYDFGQNFSGWVRLTLSGAKGTKVKIRFSEDLDSLGNLDVTCNEKAAATLEYRMKGGKHEICEPHFTFFGFRYAEVTADKGLPGILAAEGCVVHSDNMVNGSFSCDQELTGKIHHATVWSQKSNMTGYPSDCPQRDERLGWFGDAQVTAEEAMYNFRMDRFYRNWFNGIRYNQDPVTGDIPIISPRPYIRDDGVEWSSSYLTMVWDHYRFYGDRTLIKEHYPAMERYLGFLTRQAKNLVLPKGWIGDWGSLAPGWKEGDPESVPTAYFYLDAVLLSKMAGVLGLSEDSLRFAGFAGQIKEAYNKSFFHPEENNYHDGSQMANAFPLYLGLVPAGKERQVVENLVNRITVADRGHLTTGVLGTKYLPEALTAAGYPGLVWKLVNQSGYPSWRTMMERYNTMCEFWTLKQSHNHVMMGSIDSWFYSTLAGIRPVEEAAGFGKAVMNPWFPPDMERVDCWVETARGKFASAWKKKDGRISWRVSVPFNCRCEVRIPSGDTRDILESGKPVLPGKEITLLKQEGDCVIYSVGSGTYDFSFRDPSRKF